MKLPSFRNGALEDGASVRFCKFFSFSSDVTVGFCKNRPFVGIVAEVPKFQPDAFGVLLYTIGMDPITIGKRRVGLI